MSAKLRKTPQVRRGVLLYCVLGIALMIAVFVFSYFTFMRNATAMTRRIMDSEIAYHLAQSGLSAGIAWFDNTKNPCPLKETLITSSISSLNGQTLELPVADHDPLIGILAESGDKSRLQVMLELTDFKSMYDFDRSVSGINYSDVEKKGILRITSTGMYDGVRRTLVANKQVRVVCTVPYVVSKFTLFAQDFSSSANSSAENAGNGLPIKKTGFSSSSRMTGYPYSGALTLDNGDDVDIEKRGWVFLGASGPRYLNLAYGKTLDGEEHHLLKTPWELTGNGLLGPGFTSKFIQKGIFSDIQTDNRIFRNLDFSQPADDPVTDRSALIRIFGTCERPSPTILLGPVYRRFLMLRYVRHSSGKHVVLPYANQVQFDTQADLFPDNLPFDVKAGAFNNDYSVYEAFMSTVFEEPYNSSVDLLQSPSYQGMVPPPALNDLQLIQDRDNRDGYLYIPSANVGEVKISATGGLELFSGNLRMIGSGEMYCVRKRKTYSVPANVFPSFLNSSPARIPGIIHFSGGGIVIDKPLRLVEGGIVSVDGDIKIQASITTQGAKSPLTLMSQTGKISIETDELIEASLVALSGTIEKKSGIDVKIHGNIVVKTLDASTLLKGGGDIELEYDTRLDPAVASFSAYSCYLSPERSYCQE